MDASHAWADDPGWQRFTLGWYVLWPGWLVGLAVAVASHLDIVPAFLLMFAIMAAGQYLRLLTLPGKNFQRFRVAVYRGERTPGYSLHPTEAFYIAARVVPLQALILILMYGVASWFEYYPILGPLLTQFPWFNASRIGFAVDRQYRDFRPKLIPHERVP